MMCADTLKNPLHQARFKQERIKLLPYKRLQLFCRNPVRLAFKKLLRQCCISLSRPGVLVVANLAAISGRGFPWHMAATNLTEGDARQSVGHSTFFVRLVAVSILVEELSGTLKGHIINDGRPYGLGFLLLTFMPVRLDANVGLVPQHRLQVIYGEVTDSLEPPAAFLVLSDAVAVVIEPPSSMRKTTLPQESIEGGFHSRRHLRINIQKTGSIGNSAVSNRDAPAVVKTPCGSYSNVCFDPFTGLLALKLREVYELEHQHFACGGGRIEVFSQAHKSALVLPHHVPHAQKIPIVPRKPGEFRNQDKVYFSIADGTQ